MKNKIILFTALLFITANQTVFAAQSMGNEKGNGGDSCELKIQETIEDIRQWLLKDQFQGMKFPHNMTASEYKEAMLDATENLTLGCVSETLRLNDYEKTCINKGRDIKCNYKRFSSLNEHQTYKLIHHELAGIAGLEANITEESRYELSDQITSFLSLQKTLKLGMNKNIKEFPITYTFRSEFGEKDRCEWAKEIAYYNMQRTCDIAGLHCMPMITTMEPIKITTPDAHSCTVSFPAHILEKKTYSLSYFRYQKTHKASSGKLINICEKARKSAIEEAYTACLEAGGTSCYYSESKIIDAKNSIEKGKKIKECTIEMTLSF